MRQDQACPKMRFLDSERHMKSILTSLSCEPVLGQKMMNSEQSHKNNCIKKFEHIKSFRTDLKNLVMSEYNCSVESIPDLLVDFNRRYPGYKQVLEYQDLLNEAEKLNSWGWTS
jgi:putative DNA primase/helicase